MASEMGCTTMPLSHAVAAIDTAMFHGLKAGGEGHHQERKGSTRISVTVQPILWKRLRADWSCVKG